MAGSSTESSEGKGSGARHGARYWLSFDIPLRGNYKKLYELLDSLDARECGPAVATFKTTQSEELLTRKLKKAAGEDGRLYLISTRRGGKFIQGRRKAPPWTGYGQQRSLFEEDSDV